MLISNQNFIGIKYAMPNHVQLTTEDNMVRDTKKNAEEMEKKGTSKEESSRPAAGKSSQVKKPDTSSSRKSR